MLVWMVFTVRLGQQRTSSSALYFGLNGLAAVLSDGASVRLPHLGEMFRS